MEFKDNNRLREFENLIEEELGRKFRLSGCKYLPSIETDNVSVRYRVGDSIELTPRSKLKEGVQLDWNAFYYMHQEMVEIREAITAVAKEMVMEAKVVCTQVVFTMEGG